MRLYIPLPVHVFNRYFFLVDIGSVPLTISVTPCSSVVSMTVLWRTMPDEEEYYYYDDDDLDVGMCVCVDVETCLKFAAFYALGM